MNRKQRIRETTKSQKVGNSTVTVKSPVNLDTRLRRMRFRRSLPFFLSGMLLIILVSTNAHAFESAEFAIEELCGHMEGALGALLMSAAGVGAIAAAAFGNFRASFSFLITGIGAFTVSAMLSLYFPAAADKCSGDAAGGGAAANGGGAGGGGGGGGGGGQVGGGGGDNPFDFP